MYSSKRTSRGGLRPYQSTRDTSPRLDDNQYSLRDELPPKQRRDQDNSTLIIDLIDKIEKLTLIVKKIESKMDKNLNEWNSVCSNTNLLDM